MSSTESPATTASPEEARREELEALFRQWEQGSSDLDGEAAPAPAPAAKVRMRIMTTLILLGLTSFVMVSTRASVGYWLEPAEPRPLGDLRQQWVDGARTLETDSNRHVSVEGLIPSRLIAVTTEGDEAKVTDDAVEYIFHCPLFNITVLTAQPIRVPAYRMPEIDAEMAEVVQKGLAFPADTLVRFSGAGRLLRGHEAPPSMRNFVATYARRLDKPIEETWVFLDGRPPSGETSGAIIWGFAALPPLVSLFFLARALRARRRHR